ARKKNTDIMDGMAWTLEVIHDEERPRQRPVVLVLILIMVTLIVHATLTLAF
ncbi:hypothetical protein K439DRAFT_1629077, partial [Ramaria rubella]